MCLYGSLYVITKLFLQNLCLPYSKPILQGEKKTDTAIHVSLTFTLTSPLKSMPSMTISAASLMDTSSASSTGNERDTLVSNYFCFKLIFLISDLTKNCEKTSLYQKQIKKIIKASWKWGNSFWQFLQNCCSTVYTCIKYKTASIKICLDCRYITGFAYFWLHFC